MFALLSLAAYASRADGPSEAQPYVEVADLADVIKTRNVDKILETLNQVKQMRYRGLVLPYLLDLWNLRRDRYQDLPWDVVSLDVVRLDIGNVLAQAGRNGLIEIDSNGIHDFAAGLIRSADVIVAGNALWTLSIFDRPQDVAEIKSVALTRQGRPFYLAVMALADMCNDSPTKALADLESAHLTAEQVEFVTNQMQRSTAWKKRTDFCRSSEQ